MRALGLDSAKVFSNLQWKQGVEIENCTFRPQFTFLNFNTYWIPNRICVDKKKEGIVLKELFNLFYVMWMSLFTLYEMAQKVKLGSLPAAFSLKHVLSCLPIMEVSLFFAPSIRYTSHVRLMMPSKKAR